MENKSFHPKDEIFGGCVEVIVLLAIALFLFAIVFGQKVNAQWVWDFVDPIYYCIGAVAVIFVYYEAESLREHIRLQKDLAKAETSLEALQAFQPTVPVSDLTVDQIGMWIASIEEANAVPAECSEDDRPPISCLVHEDMKFMLEDAVTALNGFGDMGDIADVCMSASNMFDEFTRISRVTPPLAELTSQIHHLGGGQTLEWFQVVQSRRAIEDGKVELTNLARNIANATSMNSADHRFQIQIFETELEKLVLLLDTFEFCMRAHHGDFRTWEERQAEAVETVKNLKISLEEIRKPSDELTWIERFTAIWWVYFLVAALAAKFAKSTRQLPLAKYCLHIKQSLKHLR